MNEWATIDCGILLLISIPPPNSFVRLSELLLNRGQNLSEMFVPVQASSAPNPVQGLKVFGLNSRGSEKADWCINDMYSQDRVTLLRDDDDCC